LLVDPNLDRPISSIYGQIHESTRSSFMKGRSALPYAVTWTRSLFATHCQSHRLLRTPEQWPRGSCPVPACGRAACQRLLPWVHKRLIQFFVLKQSISSPALFDRTALKFEQLEEMVRRKAVFAFTPSGGIALPRQLTGRYSFQIAVTTSTSSECSSACEWRTSTARFAGVNGSIFFSLVF
jgi:hypothetical protein